MVLHEEGGAVCGTKALVYGLIVGLLMVEDIGIWSGGGGLLAN